MNRLLKWLKCLFLGHDDTDFLKKRTCAGIEYDAPTVRCRRCGREDTWP
jgi:hypothetical protein